MKKILLATTALAFVAAHASAVDVEMYGQVNKGLFGYNDGAGTDVIVTDNGLSSTRFGVKGAQTLDNGLTASVLFEGEMTSNASDEVTQASVNGSTGTATTPTSTGSGFNERQARVGLSGNFGGIYLGQQSTAIDGVLTQDLTGAQDVMTADYAAIGGGLKFRGANDAFVTVGGVSATAGGFTSGIAQSRDDSVRYDSPIFSGFQARVSVAQGGNTEGAVFYDGSLATLKVKGAAGVRFNNNQTSADTTGDLEYVTSFSAAHDSGLAGTIAYTKQEQDGRSDADAWYAKVGYSVGAYEVAADYGKSSDFTVADSKLNAYGLGAQYNMGNGVSLAGLYRKYDADVASSSLSDIDLYGVNMRVKF